MTQYVRASEGDLSAHDSRVMPDVAGGPTTTTKECESQASENVEGQRNNSLIPHANCVMTPALIGSGSDQDRIGIIREHLVSRSGEWFTC